jgi:hypothetical protein
MRPVCFHQPCKIDPVNRAGSLDIGEQQYASRPATSAIGSSNFSKVHWRGALSRRQRRSFVPCRKRSPVTWSKRTSTTSSGWSGSHSPLRSVFHRLGPPGAFSGKARRFPECFKATRQSSSHIVCDGGGEADMIELALFVVKTKQERSHLAALALTSEAAETQSAVRKRLTLIMARWSVQTLCDNSLRRPRPKSISQRFACSRSRVYGEMIS